ncbi:MAG TPA: hypothetical protein VKB84_11665 [Candidatus Binataceae bacterium]|jgi:hypothetical protein|nr:hypothetical protein [Candidatus Binataceae bacterium]
MRFKAWCAQCGHSAACHGSKRWCTSCLILLTLAVLLVGSVALFGNLRHGAMASADIPVSAAALQPAVKD